MTAFLGALGLFNNIMPPYAATVILELWQKSGTTGGGKGAHGGSDGEYYVRIVYKNDTEPTTLTLEGMLLVVV